MAYQARMFARRHRGLVWACGAVAAALVRTCAQPGADAGTIFAVLGYVLMYVTSILQMPLLVQQFNRLRDISRRLQSEIDPAASRAPQ